MAKKFSEYVRERRADQSAEGREAERVFRAAYAFGRVIYSARKARNLRQSDVEGSSRASPACGVAQADISRIERGMIAPTVPTLIKLADALVLPPGESNYVDADDHGEVFALSVGA